MLLRRVSLLLAVSAFSPLLSHAGVITYAVSPLGGGLFTYNYTLTGFNLVAGEEVDLRFDPLLYSNLTNGLAGPGFDLFILQPNNPPGTSGDYSAVAKTNNPSLAGTFAVTFNWLGSGTPGSQPYFLNLFDTNGQHILEQGQTTPAGPSVPEPSPQSLATAAICLGAVLKVLRRRKLLA